jgi:hypothetical protein
MTQYSDSKNVRRASLIRTQSLLDCPERLNTTLIMGKTGRTSKVILGAVREGADLALGPLHAKTWRCLPSWKLRFPACSLPVLGIPIVAFQPSIYMCPQCVYKEGPLKMRSVFPGSAIWQNKRLSTNFKSVNNGRGKHDQFWLWGELGVLRKPEDSVSRTTCCPTVGWRKYLADPQKSAKTVHLQAANTI